MKLTAILRKFPWQEIVIICLLLVAVKHIIQPTRSIAGDGEGYYDYLPAVFLRNDLDDSNPKTYNEKKKAHVCYIETEGVIVNKYPAGPAVLQLPFFLYTKANFHKNYSADPGYEEEFHKGVFKAAVFYLALGLLFLRLFLQTYKLSFYSILITQIATVFATSMIHYVSSEASYSHVFSFFAITGFLLMSRKYFTEFKVKWLLLMALFLGIATICRTFNILIIGMIPFVAGNWENLKQGFILLVQRWNYLIAAIGIFGSVVFIQLLAWKIQSNHWFIDTYPGEYFDFTDSHFVDILFSYRRGLFVYAPILFISLLSSFLWFKKEKFQFFAWIGFLVIISWILSCWWAWHFSCSFGHRMYVDYYAFLFVPFAFLVHRIHYSFKILLSIVVLMLSCLMVFQALQYDRYIFHWDKMDKRTYWEIFLHQEVQFQGLNWKQEVEEKFEKYKSYRIGKIDFSQPKYTEILYDTIDLDSDIIKLNFRLEADGFFNEKWNSRYLFEIFDADTKQPIDYREVPVIHLRDKQLNLQQRGYYNHIYPYSLPKRIYFHIALLGKEKVILNNAEFTIFVRRNAKSE